MHPDGEGAVHLLRKLFLLGGPIVEAVRGLLGAPGNGEDDAQLQVAHEVIAAVPLVYRLARACLLVQLLLSTRPSHIRTSTKKSAGPESCYP